MVALMTLLVVLAQSEPPPLPTRAMEQPTPPPVVMVAPAAARPSPSLVRVKCPQDCTVRSGSGAGRRVSPQLWEFTDVPAGKTRFDIEGFATVPIAAGYLDIPAGSEAEVLVSRNRLTLGTVTPRATPAVVAPGAPAGQPGILRITCQKPCTVMVDGQRRTGENQQGQLTISNVTPGTHQVFVKFISGSAQLSVDMPADHEVFLFASDGSAGLRLTNSKPLH